MADKNQDTKPIQPDFWARVITFIPFAMFVWVMFETERWIGWLPILAELHWSFLIATSVALATGLIIKALPRPISSRFRLSGIFEWLGG